jgi:Fe-S-cluster-containing dehydrogenase component
LRTGARIAVSALYILLAREKKLYGLGACVEACPYQAKFLAESAEERRVIKITIDGEILEVVERITVLNALAIAGYSISPSDENRTLRS